MPKERALTTACVTSMTRMSLGVRLFMVSIPAVAGAAQAFSRDRYDDSRFDVSHGLLRFDRIAFLVERVKYVRLDAFLPNDESAREQDSGVLFVNRLIIASDQE